MKGDQDEFGRRLEELRELAQRDGVDIAAELGAIGRKLGGEAAAGSAMERVRLARQVGRPTALEYIGRICDEFLELHGDRAFGDDLAMVGGIGLIDGQAYTIIGQHRGSNIKEMIYRKNGMAEPEGYRKALRLARQAEKFGRPILTLIDTQGAYPGVSSEERGIGEAIARNLKELSLIGTPIVCVIIGEAESGGALGIGVGDEVWMLENAVYSVISPEGCASILLRDSSKAEYAADLMKITAKDLVAAGAVDGIIAEPPGGAHNDPAAAAAAVKARVVESFARLGRLGVDELLARRFERLSSMGVYEGKRGGQESFLRRFIHLGGRKG